MKRDFGVVQNRYRNIIALIIILLTVLAARLFVLTMLQHDRWSAEAQEQNTKTILTPGPRGDIYDRNGNVLATTKQIFTATFNASSLSTEEINNSALALINKLIEDGDTYKDDFPIKIEDGKYYYTYDQEKDDWLKEHGFNSDATAMRVLNHYRAQYNINPELDRYQAFDDLEKKYKLSLPISPKTMQFIYQLNIENFWKKFGFKEEEIKKGISAKDCFEQLRKKYKVDPKLSDEEARKIFIVRNEVANNGFNRYRPITVGSQLKQDTVVYLEEVGIPGVNVVSASQRVYPNGSLASHVIGYMGAISESEVDEYLKTKDYVATDLVGKDGIEGALEKKLHGRPGVKRIRVNSGGEYVDTVSDTPAKKGQDVYLTLDMNLQKAAEAALAKAITGSKNSKSGCAVAIDPKTGDVLALASYPTFDLNMFADGITSAEWKSVQPINPRDNLSPAPLYNNATMTAVAPGSTFKPATALTALECGLDPNRAIYDKGFIKLGDRRFGCDLWNRGGGSHGSETMEWGIGNSCNYYFYCIATNKDWGSGASLGYSQEITPDRIIATAQRLGLGEKTGIEIGETIRPVASAKLKMQNYKFGVWNAIYDKASVYFPKEVYDDKKTLEDNISKIANLIEENPSYDKLIEFIKNNTSVKKDQVENLAAMVKFDYFNLATWTTGDAFNVSIGQGDNAYTPIQMANYLSTLAHRGQRNQINLVYGISGEGKTVKEKQKDTGVKEKDWAAVVKGMKRVCSSGTMSGTYGNYPVVVAGKTGTAENQGVKQPADEVAFLKSNLSGLNGKAGTNVSWSQVEERIKQLMLEEPDVYQVESDAADQALIDVSNKKITGGMINSLKGGYDDFSWAMTFAPADDPKIAVVVMLVEGGYSSTAVPVTRAILDAYFGYDKKTGKDASDKEKKDAEKQYVKDTLKGVNQYR